MFKCKECKRNFKKPLLATERHGLDTPPFEGLYICPHCGWPAGGEEDD